MPAGDRTGPWGLGPRTGRGLGFCSGLGAPGYAYPGAGLGLGWGYGFGGGFGRGFGRGFGLGRGRGYWRRGFGSFPGYPFRLMNPFPLEPSREEEKAWLADQAKSLEQQLARIQKRLAELEKEKAESK